MNPKTRDKRRILGLCPYCGNKIDTNGKMCSACRQKNSRQAKERREYYLSHKICPYCGTEKLFGNEKSCPECRAKRSERSAKCRDKDKKRHNVLTAKSKRTRYHLRKQQGLCTRCGKYKAVSGMCDICKSKKREYERKIREKRGVEIPRQERVSYGLCYTCGNPLDRIGHTCIRCAARTTLNLPVIRGGGKHWEEQNELIFKNQK